MEDHFRALADLHRVLTTLDLRYAIGGSLASSLAGEARSSLDADVIVELTLPTLPAFLTAVDLAFYSFPDRARDAVAAGRSFNIIHKETLFKIDIFVAGHDRLTPLQLQRRRVVVLTAAPALSLFFISPEDVVIAKLVWFKKTDETSDRQWRDVLGVLKVRRGTLDLDYLRTAAETCGVRRLFDRAVAEAGGETGQDSPH